MTAAGFLVMAVVAVVVYCVGVHHGESTRPDPVDPDEPNLLDVAPVTYVGGWTPPPSMVHRLRNRAADHRLQNICRPPAVVALPRRKAQARSTR